MSLKHHYISLLGNQALVCHMLQYTDCVSDLWVNLFKLVSSWIIYIYIVWLVRYVKMSTPTTMPFRFLQTNSVCFWGGNGALCESGMWKMWWETVQRLVWFQRKRWIPTSPWQRDLYQPSARHWLVVWDIFYFSNILGMSSSQLTNSIIFQRGRSTTNQIINHPPNHHR